MYQKQRYKLWLGERVNYFSENLAVLVEILFCASYSTVLCYKTSLKHLLFPINKV